MDNNNEGNKQNETINELLLDIININSAIYVKIHKLELNLNELNSKMEYLNYRYDFEQKRVLNKNLRKFFLKKKKNIDEKMENNLHHQQQTNNHVELLEKKEEETKQYDNNNNLEFDKNKNIVKEEYNDIIQSERLHNTTSVDCKYENFFIRKNKINGVNYLSSSPPFNKGFVNPIKFMAFHTNNNY